MTGTENQQAALIFVTIITQNN